MFSAVLRISFKQRKCATRCTITIHRPIDRAQEYVSMLSANIHAGIFNIRPTVVGRCYVLRKVRLRDSQGFSDRYWKGYELVELHGYSGVPFKGYADKEAQWIMRKGFHSYIAI